MKIRQGLMLGVAAVALAALLAGGAVATARPARRRRDRQLTTSAAW